MDELQLTRSYLETLSTLDLENLAERLGLDLPPDLNRVFVIEELLDAAGEDEQPPKVEIDDFSEIDETPQNAAGLPENYNETFIEVLVRDPLWAFAFWEIKSLDRENCERGPGFGGYRLRVSAIHSGEGRDENSFHIAVDAMDSAWYVCFPSPKGWFRVDLCAVMDQREVVLASSNPIRIPADALAEGLGEEDHPLRSILELSGIDELRVMRNSDRKSRLPERCEY